VEQLTINDVRPEVISFALDMERILRLNDYKGGWKQESIFYLTMNLRKEYIEVMECIEEYDYIHLSYELTDLANTCMMLNDKLKRCGL